MFFRRPDVDRLTQQRNARGLVWAVGWGMSRQEYAPCERALAASAALCDGRAVPHLL
jgi:hypothetical protein